MDTITVRKSSPRSWMIALLGAALLIVALELLVGNGLVDRLAEHVFLGEEVTEARERIWAGIMGFLGVALGGWGVISALGRRPAAVLDPQGLQVALRGPFRPLDLLPWESIDQVYSQEVTDGGTLLPSLTIVLQANSSSPQLPVDPWGARWTGGPILRVLAADWNMTADEVAAASRRYLSEIAPMESAANHE